MTERQYGMTARTLVGILAVLAFAACQSADDRMREREAWAAAGFEDALAAPVPPGNVRIVVDRVEVASTDAASLNFTVAARLPVGVIEVGGPGLAHGLEVFAVEPSFRVAMRATASSSQSQRLSREFLVVAPGSAGSLTLQRSQSTPLGLLLPGAPARVQAAATGFDVEVLSIADGRVDLAFRPFFTSLDSGRRTRITEIDTRISVPAGQPFVVMARRDHDATVFRQLLGTSSRERRSEVVLVLTPQIGPPIPAP